MTVLFIDDDADLREAVVDVLECNGFEAASAQNGHEAIAWLTGHAEPDLVILDWFMPDMDGPTFLHELKQQTQLPAIVVITGAMRLDESIPISLGALEVVKKPFSLEGLLSLVQLHGGKARS